MIIRSVLLASTALVAAYAFAGSATAGGHTKDQDRDQKLQELQAQLDALKQEVADSKLEADAQQRLQTRVNALEDRANDVQWSFDNGRPTIKSGDGRFSLAIRGRFHFDAVNFFQDDFNPATPAAQRDLSSGAVMRRAYLGVEGTVFKDFDYEMRFNLGGSDAEQGDPFVNIMRVAYKGIPDFRLNVGVIQPVFTLGDSISSNEILMMERPGIVATVVGNFGGDDSRRGVELTYQKAGALFPDDNLVLSGAFTGARTGSAHTGTSDEQTQVLGRVAYRFYSDSDTNLQIGADAARVNNLTGAAAPGGVQALQLRERIEERVDGTRLIDTGSIAIDSATVWGVEAAGNFMNFYLSGEYFSISEQRDLVCAAGCLATTTAGLAGKETGDPEFHGWYVEGSWVLTGEKKPYSAGSSSNSMGVWGSPRPAIPFSLAGDSWGAWELVLRYSDEDLNWQELIAPANGGIRGGEQKISSIGLNWYLNNNIRTMIDYSHVDVDRLNAAGAQQGQTLDWLGTRVSFAF